MRDVVRNVGVAESAFLPGIRHPENQPRTLPDIVMVSGDRDPVQGMTALHKHFGAHRVHLAHRSDQGLLSLLDIFRGFFNAAFHLHAL